MTSASKKFKWKKQANNIVFLSARGEPERF